MLRPGERRRVRPPARPRARPRVRPSLVVAGGVVVAFEVVSILRANKSLDYTRLGDTLHSAVFDLLVREAVSLAVLAAIVTALGWWRLAVVEPTRPRRTARWTLIAPLALGAVALGRFALVDWGGVTPLHVLVLAAGFLLVGCFEELMFRGSLLLGLRVHLPEWLVWLVSSLVFGLVHLTNTLYGEPGWQAILQAAFAAAFGSALYIARRYGGSLLWPILLHAVWDLSAVVAGFSGIENRPIIALLGLLLFALLPFSVVAAPFATRSEGLRRGWALEADAGRGRGLSGGRERGLSGGRERGLSGECGRGRWLAVWSPRPVGWEDVPPPVDPFGSVRSPGARRR